MDVSKLNKIFLDGFDNGVIINSDSGIINFRLQSLNSNDIIYGIYLNQNTITKYINSYMISTGKQSFIVRNVSGDEITIDVGTYKLNSFVKDKTIVMNIKSILVKNVNNKNNISIDAKIVGSCIMIFNFHNIHPEYFSKKVISSNGKKKGKKIIKVEEYYFNRKYFIDDYICFNDRNRDRIIIGSDYSLYDPNNLLKPVFPLDHCAIMIGFDNFTLIDTSKKNTIPMPDYNHKIVSSAAITVDKSHDKPNILLIEVLFLQTNGQIMIAISCMYDINTDKITSISNATYGERYYVNFALDIFKYMVYHAELVSKKDVVIGSINASSNYTPKVNDKPRFETSIYSHKVYGITKKVIPVTEAEAKEKRKYTPCQYAVTVKGHFRHYKSGKVIWVEHYIRNKDKEFKPKDYVDKKKEG